MIDNPIDSPDCESLTTEAWQQALAAQRARAEEILGAQSSAIDGIERELAAQLEHLTAEASQVATEGDAWDRQQWRDRSTQLEARLNDAQQIKAALVEQQDAWRQSQAEVAADQQERLAQLDNLQRRVDARTAELDARQLDLTGQQTQLELTKAEAASRHDYYQRRLTQLDEERSELAGLKDETLRQRRRIAREFRRERTALHERLADSQRLAEETAAALDAARGEATAVTSTPESNAASANWQRKYDLAMEEIHQLQTENEQLQSRPAAKVSVTAAQTGSPITDSFDWEAEKRRMFSQLEDGHSGTDGGTQRDRLAMEAVIRKTDEIVEAKDREIAKLREELEAAENVVSNADELERLVDADDLIQQERSHLEQLQQELREKQRQAEIELSMERAKIARERAELEEKANAVPSKSTTGEETGEDGKSNRGRWLSRLGLADEEEA